MRLLVVSLLALLSFGSVADERSVLLRYVDTEKRANSVNEISAHLSINDAFVEREGSVQLSPASFSSLVNTAQNARSETSATAFTLELFPDQSFDINVLKQVAHGEKKFTVYSQTADLTYSNVTLVFTPETFIITIREEENNKIYRVVGDMATGLGDVQEVSTDKIPERRHGHVIPRRKEQ